MLPAVKARVDAIVVRPIEDSADQAFVVHMKHLYAERNGLPHVAWDNALYFVAKHVITGERLGCMAVNMLAPLGHYFVGDFFTVDGRNGKLAALALFEALHGSEKPIMGLIALSNQSMTRAAKAYGYEAVATLYQINRGKVRS